MTPAHPPENTPAGTTCWLYYDPPDRQREWVALIWHPPSVYAGVYDVWINRVARHGWKFHSVAITPQEPTP